MSRSLPSRPSLVQLKHQAKDLRSAAGDGEAEALAMLRRLDRLATASDAQIAASQISLSEAQFALALEYGASSFAELKRRVEALRGAEQRAPLRDNGTVTVPGLEASRWGGGTRRQCSTVATLSLVSEHLGDDSDYDYLMGASGAAFRVQMARGQLCPSSPHAACGFNCAELALRAWGNDVAWISTRDEAERASARSNIAASIEQGVPVLYEEEESSLIVGYTADALLVRRCGAEQPGYEPMQKWPWSVGIASPKKSARPESRRVLEDSLRLATQLFETPEVGRYTSGRNAYVHWAELLVDETAFAKKSDSEWFGSLLGNAHTFACLADARGAASNYLTSAATFVEGEAQAALTAAAEVYGEIEVAVRQCRHELAPFPWELERARDFSLSRRQALVDRLEQFRHSDEKAMSLLARALSSLALRGP